VKVLKTASLNGAADHPQVDSGAIFRRDGLFSVAYA